MLGFHVNIIFPYDDDDDITLSIKNKKNSSYSNHNPKQKAKTVQQIYTNANVNILTCQKPPP